MPYGDKLPRGIRRILQQNGTLHADFVPSEATAAARGWALEDGRPATPTAPPANAVAGQPGERP